MAVVPINAPGGQTLTVNNTQVNSGVNNYTMGSGSSDDIVGRYVVDLRGSGVSMTVTGRARETANPFLAIPYIARYLNGAVGTDAVVSTAITSDSIISIISDGLEIGLNFTSVGAGSMTVDVRPCSG